MEPQDRERITGLRQDIESLLVRFLQTQNVRFQMFAEEWRKLNFTFVHYGIERTIEKKEVIQEAYRITTEYLLPPYDLQRRVGALYILYGLYVTQPHQPKFKIRISLDQWKNVILLMDTLKAQGHLDTMYVFHKLVTSRAFTFTARPNKMVFHVSFMEGKPEQNPIERWLDRHRLSLMTECFDDATLEMHHDLHEQYQQMKVNLGLHDNTSLMMVRESITEYIVKRCEKLEVDSEAARAHKRASDSDDPGDKEQNLKASQIKARSYSAVAKASKSRRHRQQSVEPTTVTDSHMDQSNPEISNSEFSDFDNESDDATWTPKGLKKGKTSHKKKTSKQEAIKESDGLVSRIQKKISRTAKAQSLEEEDDSDSHRIREKYLAKLRDITTSNKPPKQEFLETKGRKGTKSSATERSSTSVTRTPQKQKHGNSKASSSSANRAQPGSSNMPNAPSSLTKSKIQDSESPSEVTKEKTERQKDNTSGSPPKKRWKKSAQDLPDDAGPSMPSTSQTLQSVTTDKTGQRSPTKGFRRYRNVKVRGGGFGARTRGARNNVPK